MGNRAVISFTNTSSSPCVYVHWNGGRASIEGFLRAAKRVNLAPDIAELHKLIKGFIGSSAYLQNVGRSDCNNGDNGQYLISDDWRITGRLHSKNHEEINPEKTTSIAIDCIAEWQYWPN